MHFFMLLYVDIFFSSIFLETLISCVYYIYIYIYIYIYMKERYSGRTLDSLVLNQRFIAIYLRFIFNCCVPYIGRLK